MEGFSIKKINQVNRKLTENLTSFEGLDYGFTNKSAIIILITQWRTYIPVNKHESRVLDHFIGTPSSQI